MKNKKINLEDYLYKPLKVDESDSTIIIYALDSHSQHLLSLKGKPSKELTYILHYVDLTRSLDESDLFIDSFPINDLEAFKNSVKFVDPKAEYNNIIDLGSRLTIEIASLSAKTQTYMQLFQTLRYILGIDPASVGSDRSAFVVSDGTSGLAHIVFKTITGDTASLSKEDVERMGGVIMETIMGHMNMNTDSKEEVKKLSDELEYKLIEALPVKMKTEDVKINMTAILNEVKRFQGEKEKDNEE